MNGRLKQLRKHLDLTQQEFADRIGIARGNISAYEVDKNKPSDAVISLICRDFNVNEEWLRTGEGEMFIKRTRDEEIAAFIGKIQSSPEDNFKKQLIGILADLTEDEWEYLARFAEKLAKEKD